MSQSLGVQTASSLPCRDRVRDILVEALFRPLSVYMEITAIISQLCVGIDSISKPFDVGQMPDGAIITELQRNRTLHNRFKGLLRLNS